MSEQIKMTEEQFDKFYDECYSRDYLTMKKNVKEKGYIIKSDLEILIEEAEDMYSKMCLASQDVTCWGVAEKLHKAFIAMKAELNKRRNE